MRVTLPLSAAYALWAVWGATWLIASRWKARAVTRGAPGPTRNWLLVATLGFAGLFVEPPDAALARYALPPSAAWASVAVIAAGMAFAWWARLHLGRLWSGGIVAREGHRVVDDGPYAIVRHPIYTGLFMGAIGLAAIKATPLALAGVPVLIAGFAGKARVEERFLSVELGDEAYARYRARVPMLVPIPRARA